MLDKAKQHDEILSILQFLCCICIFYPRLKPASVHPPDPSRLPILGNMHQIPMPDIWDTYKKCHDEYGPIIYLQYGQKAVVSQGSYKVVKDLLDRRSSIYSS